MEKVAVLQTIEKKPRSLRLLSSKSAARLDVDVRQDMVNELMENPDPESVTRKFGSTAIQVVFSVLWVLAWKVRRLEGRSSVRDGFGRPVGCESVGGRDLRVMGDAA